MMSFAKHLLVNKKINLFFIAAILFLGCAEEKKKEDFIARVNDSYLSNNELKELIDTSSANMFFKNEVIRNWINRELMFQQAVEEGILEEEKYKRLIKNSERELAAAMLLNKYVSDKKIKFEQKDLSLYFEENRDEFKLAKNAYLLNIIHFSDEGRAVEFRSGLLTNGWDSTIVDFEVDSTIIDVRNNVLLNEQDIFPAAVLRVVKRLHSPEISIVISEGTGYFSIVQVLGKYLKDSLPPFDLIKDKIEVRYLAEKRNKLIEDYIENLYTTNEIEVIN